MRAACAARRRGIEFHECLAHLGGASQEWSHHYGRFQDTPDAWGAMRIRGAGLLVVGRVRVDPEAVTYPLYEA